MTSSRFLISKLGVLVSFRVIRASKHFVCMSKVMAESRWCFFPELEKYEIMSISCLKNHKLRFIQCRHDILYFLGVLF